MWHPRTKSPLSALQFVFLCFCHVVVFVLSKNAPVCAFIFSSVETCPAAFCFGHRTGLTQELGRGLHTVWCISTTVCDKNKFSWLVVKVFSLQTVCGLTSGLDGFVVLFANCGLDQILKKQLWFWPNFEESVVNFRNLESSVVGGKKFQFSGSEGFVVPFIHRTHQLMAMGGWWSCFSLRVILLTHCRRWCRLRRTAAKLPRTQKCGNTNDVGSRGRIFTWLRTKKQLMSVETHEKVLQRYFVWPACTSSFEFMHEFFCQPSAIEKSSCINFCFCSWPLQKSWWMSCSVFVRFVCSVRRNFMEKVDVVAMSIV